MYKIVNADNFDNDYSCEHFELPYKMSKEAANEFARLLNKYFSGTYAPRFWKVVKDDYILRRGLRP